MKKTKVFLPPVMKKEAVAFAQEHGPKAAAEKYGVHRSSIMAWSRGNFIYRKEKEIKPREPPAPNLSDFTKVLDQEILALRQRIEALELVRKAYSGWQSCP